MFEDVDENKLEYQQVYEDYCAIMDKCIEAKLKDEHNFSEDAIKQFMETFKDNKQAYEQANSDTFDTLYGFIDFEQFKQMMITFKKSADTNTSNISTTESSENDKIQQTYGNVDTAWGSYNEVVNEPLEGKGCLWKKKLNQKDFKDGMKCNIWQRKFEGMSNDLVRIDAQLKNITPQSVVDHYWNPIKDTAGMILENKVIERIDEDNVIQSFKIKMPMMSARDNVMKLSKKAQDGGIFFTLETVERPEYPVIPGVVRMFIYTRGFVRPN